VLRVGGARSGVQRSCRRGSGNSSCPTTLPSERVALAVVEPTSGLEPETYGFTKPLRSQSATMTKPRNKPSKARRKKQRPLLRQSTGVAPADRFTAASVPSGQHGAREPVLEARRVHQQEDRQRRMGRGCRRGSRGHDCAQVPRVTGIHPAQCLSHAAVLRGLPGRQESLSAAETTAVDPSPHSLESDEAARGSPVLHAGGHQGTMDHA
jgi:hypothetical protein